MQVLARKICLPFYLLIGCFIKNPDMKKLTSLLILFFTLIISGAYVGRTAYHLSENHQWRNTVRIEHSFCVTNEFCAPPTDSGPGKSDKIEAPTARPYGLKAVAVFDIDTKQNVKRRTTG